MNPGEVGTLELTECVGCQARFLPTDGPCPHCGTIDRRSLEVPAVGTTLAATELVHPAAGWESPHRLVLVELEGSARLLAIAEGDLPEPGVRVAVRRDGEVYRSRVLPSA